MISKMAVSRTFQRSANINESLRDEGKKLNRKKFPLILNVNKSTKISV